MAVLDLETATLEVWVELKGKLVYAQYFIEGMPEWHWLWPPDVSCYSERPAVLNEEIHIAVAWTNQSDVPVKGHIDITLTSPTGIAYTPLAVRNQDKFADPTYGWLVTFAPVVLNEAGKWTLEMVLIGTASTGEIHRASAQFEVAEAPPPPRKFPTRTVAGLSALSVIGAIIAGLAKKKRS